MKAEITFSNLYWNDNLRGFFFRSQSEDTFNEVTQRVINSPDSEREVGEFLESQFSTVDEMEEYFYEQDAENIIDEMREYGIEIDDESDED